MQTQERDDIDREAIQELARDWYATGPTARARALRTFPELAAMGLKTTDPCDQAIAANEEDILQQCRALGGELDPDPADPLAAQLAALGTLPPAQARALAAALVANGADATQVETALGLRQNEPVSREEVDGDTYG